MCVKSMLEMQINRKNKSSGNVTEACLGRGGSLCSEIMFLYVKSLYWFGTILKRCLFKHKSYLF